MNEEEEDISTGDLKYLLVAFHLGILLSATPENDPSARREWLQKADSAFARYTCKLRFLTFLQSPCNGISVCHRNLSSLLYLSILD